MSRLMISHAVTDVENWLARRPQRVADLAPFASDITDYVAADGSGRVVVALEVHDPQGLAAAMASLSPERAASIAEQGIIGPLVTLREV